MNKEEFVEKLRADGFDIIILDYDNGADYIQRNAHVLRCLINQVNQALENNGSNSQLTIIGPSMAGLISRYALYYMEQNNMDHNTGLFISFDAPNFGANIPLGDQLWIKFFAQYNGAQEALDGRAKLLTPAAEQMLVYHYSVGGGNCHSLRTGLLNDPYFGYPSKCRKVAIACGSGNSELWFDPCDVMVRYRYSSMLVSDVVIGNTWAVPSPTNGSCMIFEGRYPTEYDPILHLFPTAFVDETYTISGTQPYDDVPGGGYPTNKIIAGGDTDGNGDITADYDNHSFIPTVSALALNNAPLEYNVFSISDYPYINNQSVTPFDAIYAPIHNQGHVQVTPDNAGWMRNEISSFDLFLQNQTIETNALFEARNIITMGRDITTTIPVGNFVVTSTASVTIHAGEQIIIEDGTLFENGSDALLYVEPYGCPSAWRRANPNGSSDDNNFQVNGSNSDYTVSKKNSFIQSFPNPCKEGASIQYSIGTPGEVEISVYNIFGQRMKVLEFDNYSSAGQFISTLDASNLSPGTYICLLKTNGTVTSSLKIIVSN